MFGVKFKQGITLSHKASGELCVIVEYPPVDGPNQGNTDYATVSKSIDEEFYIDVNLIEFQITKPRKSQK
jgi:hypothetical protein